MKRAIAIASMSLLLIVAGTLAAVGVEQQVPVRVTKAWEGQPAEDAGVVAWWQATKTGSAAFAKPDGQARIRLNADSWNGAMGGIDGNVVAIEQFKRTFSAWVNKGEGQADIKLFDLTTKQRSEPPAGVNTKNWEFWPSIDGPWLLFGRVTQRAAGVILFNLATSESRRLTWVSLRHLRYVPDAGQVNGNYATYDMCSRDGSSCNVFRYDIALQTSTKLPRSAAWQYGPSVRTDGTTYYWRTTASCPYRSKLVRRSPDGHEAIVASLRPGWVSDDSYVYEAPDGSVDVSFDRHNACGSGESDIYKVVDSFSLSVTVSGSGTVTSDPVGIACSSSCSATFGGGTVVTLTPTAGSFTGWGGACSGTGTCVIRMNTDRSVTASFT
jgi:hypothetical protein